MNPNKRQQLRRKAFLEQNCQCFYCQLPIWEENLAQFSRCQCIPERLAKHLRSTAEHLVAQRDDGHDTPGNIVAACLWCNRLRHQGRQHSAPDPMSYKSKIARLVAQGKWHPVAASRRSKANVTLTQAR